MAPPTSSLEVIQDFLSQKRIALIGISRDPKSFSLLLFEELCRRGYDVVPVNPKTPNVMGRPCFARVQDIEPPVDGALIMTSAAKTDTVVADCAEAGIRRDGCTAPPDKEPSARRRWSSAHNMGCRSSPANARLCS